MTNKKNMTLNVTILLLYSTPISRWGEEIWRSNSDQEMLFSGILQHYHYKQLEKQKTSWLCCLCSSSHRLVQPRCWQNMFKLFTKQQQYPVNLILRCISHRCSKFVQHILRSLCNSAITRALQMSRIWQIYPSKNIGRLETPSWSKSLGEHVILQNQAFLGNICTTYVLFLCLNWPYLIGRSTFVLQSIFLFCFVQFKCQNCSNLSVFLRVKFGLKVLLPV